MIAVNIHRHATLSQAMHSAQAKSD
ncbi:hypothetical protein BOSE62_150303 [Bosea sp. 62]|nr:hypothetical protein BOSE46_10539 [Bosea sp. 46]CAD5250620.1 hypothetical protein BOSE21B_10757 [Bosea sp. 21B]CAD5263693.1 hypothetical protein BOSE7B_150378 [Bosea sp. 7B]VVT44013.1 hypothetical protein BOS5A_10313 [Bosea sp. EC-HK365B]VXB14747.1 hypothetical protein BOSE29B_10535 [Bosea sp. 29B]VXB77343.1 hypothetical protein BOSE62_150303 [Bosea sp. 62]VXC36532.1 hypothetical protein BOSE125_20218 [Bosea sp. 125]VXC40142.1 hypothetical protein BOSE127_190004 [Bosea sp. 127]